jgi:hypothetical protein
MTVRSEFKREALWVSLGSLGYALFFTYPWLIRLGQRSTFGDWDTLNALQWSAYYTITRFHQLPFWDPYRCGGLPLLGNPQSRILTPFFLLHLVFGPSLGVQIDMILHLALAFAGGYVLARSLGLGTLPSIVCAAVFPSTSWFYLHLAFGHTIFMCAAYLPWISWLFWLSIDKKSWTASALVGLLIALVVLEGGLHIAICAGLLLVSLAGGFALINLSLRPLLSLLVSGLFSLGLAAIRSMPVLESYGAHPAPRIGDALTPTNLLMLLFSRNQDVMRDNPLSSFGFWEYGAYLSIAFVVLAAVGIFSRRLRSVPWLLTGTTFFLFALGEHYYGLGVPWTRWALVAPWTVLKELPFFGGMFMALWMPPRYLIGLVLSISVLAALGAELLCCKLARWGPVMAASLLVIGLVDAWLVGPPNLGYTYQQIETTPSPTFPFRQSSARPHSIAGMVQANLGNLNCYEYQPITTKAVGYTQANYRGEQYLLGPGSVTLANWTPNALDFEVDAPASTVLMINQNYWPGWMLTQGQGEVFPQDELLAVRIPAGKQHLRLVYRSTRFRDGLALTLISLAAMLGLWAWERRRGRHFLC